MLDSIKGIMMARNIRSRTYYRPFFNASVTLLKNYNVVYVENSKVACTKIKKALLSMDNWPRTADEILEKEVYIHNKKKTGLIGPESLTSKGLTKLVEDPSFFRFGFVRNPYDRTLSAYVDKISAPQKDPTKKNYIPVAQKIKAHFTGADYKKINLDKQPVTYQEFIRYLSRQKPYDMDRHWLHQHLTMWHPYVRFDFLGQLETFDRDFSLVLTKIGAPEQLIRSVTKKANASRRANKKYYDETLAEEVYKIFKKDFDIYGYSKESWVNY